MNTSSAPTNPLMEDFLPRGWDLDRIDGCCSHPPNQITNRQAYWHDEFHPVECEHLEEFNTYMGHEIALAIKDARDRDQTIALILPVGPMGMYKWVVYFLRAWKVSASHVHGFNMDEWSDANGNTLSSSDPGSFQSAMETAFYGPLGEYTVPEDQRNFATRENLPRYEDKVRGLKADGAELVVVYGIGRICHIAFWEPHFADEYETEAEWRTQTHRLAARLHPLTIEQNAITNFKSRTPSVSWFANTIGPGLFLQADYAIGGCDGVFTRGIQWQGMSLWMTLRYGTTPWIPSTYMPTLPGKLFFLRELAGPLVPEMH